MVDGNALIFVKGAANPSQGPLKFEVPAGQSILAALQACGFSPKQPLVAVVNGATADLTYLLQPGDTVQCLPQIAGG